MKSLTPVDLWLFTSLCHNIFRKSPQKGLAQENLIVKSQEPENLFRKSLWQLKLQIKLKIFRSALNEKFTITMKSSDMLLLIWGNNKSLLIIKYNCHEYF